MPATLSGVFVRFSRRVTRKTLHSTSTHLFGKSSGSCMERLRLGEFSVQTELNSELPKVLGHRIQLQLVFRNLIMNAVEAMSSVTDRGRVLNISSETKPPGVRIAVADSGTGIDPESMDRIFHAFFTTKSQGTGMGLSICQSIVEAHGGQLSASRSHPHGSIFEIVLPDSQA